MNSLNITNKVSSFGNTYILYMYSAGATSTSRSRETSQVSKNQDGHLQPRGKKHVVSS